MAQLMIGEAYLLVGDYALARTWLTRAGSTNAEVGAKSDLCLTLVRLAQTEAAAAAYARANELLARARPIAEASQFRSHLLVRLLGVAVQAAGDLPAASRVVQSAERTLADSGRVCDPCSITFRSMPRVPALARATCHEPAGIWPTPNASRACGGAGRGPRRSGRRGPHCGRPRETPPRRQRC